MMLSRYHHYLLALSSLSHLVFALPPPPIAQIPRDLEHRQLRGSSTTANDLVAGSQSCAAMTLIFARGTTEPGNAGTVAGPPLFAAVRRALGTAGGGSLAAQGVDYPADVRGFLAGGDAAGSAEMARLVQLAMQKCPETKVVMSGYSQGGQLVHNAAAMLDTTTVSRVSAAVIFGDPDNGDPVAGISATKTKIICHVGDNICAGGSLVLAPHLTYGRDVGDAAAFMVAAAGL